MRDHYVRIILFIISILYSVIGFTDPVDNYESVDNLKVLAKDFIVKNIALEPEETMDVKINQADLPTQLIKCSNKIDIAFPRDLDYAQENINRLYNGYFKDKKEVVGYVASQIINSGAVITRKNVRRPQLVHKNQEIDLIAKKNQIVVTMKGISKSDGSLNDSIVAYNPSSKKTVEAIVVGLNMAEVIS